MHLADGTPFPRNVTLVILGRAVRVQYRGAKSAVQGSKVGIVLEHGLFKWRQHCMENWRVQWVSE